MFFIPPAETELEAGGDKFSSLIKTMGAPSIVELEKIIDELQQARTYLQAESERIERETVGYAELSRDRHGVRAHHCGNRGRMAQGRPPRAQHQRHLIGPVFPERGQSVVRRRLGFFPAGNL